MRGDEARNPLDLDRIEVEMPEPRLPWPAALRLITLLSAFLWLLIVACILGIRSLSTTAP